MDILFDEITKIDVSQTVSDPELPHLFLPSLFRLFQNEIDRESWTIAAFFAHNYTEKILQMHKDIKTDFDPAKHIIESISPHKTTNLQVLIFRDLSMSPYTNYL